MPIVTRYRHGVPNWADVTLTDVSAGADFYSRLFGWHAEDQGEGAGHYTMFSIDGSSVAAAGPKQPDADMPSVWGIYCSVDDLDATVAKVVPAGGSVLQPRMDIFTSGVMAVVQDPTGAVVSLWQPGEHIGAELVNEANTVAWHELLTRDEPAALDFYAAVLGWEYQTFEQDESAQETGGGYRMIVVGGREVGGMMPMEGADWGDISSHWMTYIAVDDCDTAAARAKELGATVHAEPFDIPVGRVAVIGDPEGAVFSVMSFDGPMDDVPDGVA